MTAHDILEQARNTSCICGAPPGCPCVCESGHYHKGRLCHAVEQGLVPASEVATLLWGYRFHAMDTVPDPGGVT